MKLIWKAAVAAILLSGSLALAQAQQELEAPSQEAPAQQAPEQAPPTAASAKDATATANPQTGPDYVIGPEDVLHIAVWNEANFTETVPVRPDGKMSMPLLDDVQAAGLTPKQLGDSLADKLKKYVADPRVTVVVTAINSKRIYLVGEVARTGAMPLWPDMTVLQALSSAGLTQFANTKKIYVLRTMNGKQAKLPVNYRKLVKGLDMDRNYVLQTGDTIVIP